MVAVQYQILNDDQSLQNAQYRLTNPQQQIESYVFDVVRSSVPKIELDDVFTTKDEISDNIKHNLTESMGSFGYEIVSSPITDIDPNAEVKRAMNEINKAKRLRMAALAEGEAKYMAGQGISRQRQAIIAGLRDSVNSFKS